MQEVLERTTFVPRTLLQLNDLVARKIQILVREEGLNFAEAEIISRWEIVEVIHQQFRRYTKLIVEWPIQRIKPVELTIQLIGQPCRVGIVVYYKKLPYFVIGLAINWSTLDVDQCFSVQMVIRKKIEYLAILPENAFEYLGLH